MSTSPNASHRSPAGTEDVMKALDKLVFHPSTDDLSKIPTDPSSPSTPTEPTATKKSRKKKKTKPAPCPNLQIFVGNFVHSITDCPFVVLEDCLIGVEDGKILFIENANQLECVIENNSLRGWEDQCITTMGQGCFLMPGFVDCYAQPVQTLASAFTDDDPSVTPSSPRSKLNLIHDDRIARRHLKRGIEHALSWGTTCALYNGSTVESAARLLADTAATCQQRALVGFDVSCGDSRDDTHMFQLTKAWDVVRYIKRRQPDKVSPLLMMSHPLPDWLMQKALELRKQEHLRVVCSIHGEREDELRSRLGHWVGFGENSPLKYLKQNSMVDKECMFIHSQHLTPRDRSVLQEAGSSVVFCPSADLSAAPFWSNIPANIAAGLNVGIGTDCNGKHSVLGSIQEYSTLKKLQKRVPRPVEIPEKSDSIETEETVIKSPEPGGPLNMAQLFYMATLGGAKALGLDQQIGNFEIGKDFDAIVVDTMTARSSFLAVHRKDNLQDLVQKFLLLGDDHNVAQVYVRGIRVK